MSCWIWISDEPFARRKAWGGLFQAWEAAIGKGQADQSMTFEGAPEGMRGPERRTCVGVETQWRCCLDQVRKGFELEK